MTKKQTKTLVYYIILMNEHASSCIYPQTTLQPSATRYLTYVLHKDFVLFLR